MRTAFPIGFVMIAAAAVAGDAALALLPGPGSVLNPYADISGDFSKAEFTIESASIICRNTWVSEKDRGRILKVALEDMLAASKYATARFACERISSAGPEAFKVEGQLSTRTVTRPLTFEVRRTAIATYTGEARLRFADFGLKPPSAALGLARDEMLFTFTLSARPTLPEQSA